MADEPKTNGQEPNLELPPLLGFGRKKKGRKTGVTPAGPTSGRDTPAPAPQHPPAAPDGPAEAAAPELLETPVAAPDSEHAEGVEPATRGPETRARSGRETVRQRAITRPPVSAPIAQTATEQTSKLAAQVDAPPRSSAEEPTPVPPTGRGRGGAAMQVPVIDPRVAAVAAGAVVGLVGVVLAFLAGRGCEAVRGVGSCGGIGLFALLLIVAIEILIGAALLKTLRVYDPVSTSFLGVGLAAVFVLLFLLSSLDSVLMVLVVPAISGITFLVSWWVTTSLVDGSG